MFYDYIAQSSGGSSHVVPTFERDSMNLYVDLMHAFSGLLTTETEKPAQLPATVHENLIPMTGKIRNHIAQGCVTQGPTYFVNNSFFERSLLII